MEREEIWLRLSQTRGLSLRHSLSLFEGLQESDVTLMKLYKMGMTTQQACQFLATSTLNETYHWLGQDGHAILPYNHADYPERLKEITQPPLLLYVWGNIEVLSQPQLAVVGSRQHSHYGEQQTEWFVHTLAAIDIVITSGLAIGIDAIAHQSALSVQGKTIAVLGSGIARLYPALHQALACRIVEQGGAIVSEFPPTTTARPGYFPQRNRIISGLSLAVLIVEAEEKSGSLVTARHALEQGRDIFAIPGAVDNRCSQGTNRLIQQGAYLAAHPNDISDQLNSSLKWLTLPDSSSITIAEDKSILPYTNVLASVDDSVTPIDIIVERAHQSVAEVAAALLELELIGRIKSVPGGYVKLRERG